MFCGDTITIGINKAAYILLGKKEARGWRDLLEEFIDLLNDNPLRYFLSLDLNSK